VNNAGAARHRVVSYPLDDDLILLDTGTQRIFVLNATAAFLWRGLDAGLTAAEVAAELGRRAAAPPSVALRDCEALVAEWTAAGLLGEAAAEPPIPTRRRGYRVAGCELRLVGPPEAIEAAHGLLGHLSVDPSALAPHSPTLTISATAGGFALSEGERELGRCEGNEQLVPLIHATVVVMTYESCESLLAIHGAAVARGDTCVLLPGLPGNGKSTLTAALVAAGYDFCTDDLAMLAGRPLRLTPLPLRLGLKSGSWTTLRDRLPDLEAQPVHLRRDGQSVKYWLPPPERLPPRAAAGLRVAALVFPRYRADAECALVPISRSHALLGIAEAGYHLLEGRLDEPWMETTLEWLRTLSCFELSYSSLDDAIAAFADVLP
jgi:hypothetical protein